MDPKSFYDSTMPAKYGSDYEHARWDSSPRRKAQRAMMEATLGRLVLPHIKGAQRILEIGPGAGTWTKLLLDANPTASYTLVDISQEMLSRASRALEGRSNITYVESDFTNFESNEKFDVIFSSRAIEYMPDKTAVAEKMSSLLSPRGTAYILTKMPKPLFNRILGRKLPPLHQGQVSPRSLMKTFRKKGFRTQAHIAIANIPLLDSPLFNTLTFHFLRVYPMISPFSWFAESYIVTARKS